MKLGLLRDGKPVDATATLTATSRPRKLGARPASVSWTRRWKRCGKGTASRFSRSPRITGRESGLKVGDWVFKLNGDELNRPARLRDMLEDKKPGDVITFLVVQDKKEVEVKATLSGDRPQGKGGSAAVDSAAVAAAAAGSVRHRCSRTRSSRSP